MNSVLEGMVRLLELLLHVNEDRIILVGWVIELLNRVRGFLLHHFSVSGRIKCSIVAPQE